ncbi:MAG: proton-translocating NADH-quinone oxidoreductase, chain [Proteobacteria bacterium]|nr:proton-translocating NADH-quinone oxidoreductase, chain [Pseudomonadota bacterium]
MAAFDFPLLSLLIFFPMAAALGLFMPGFSNWTRPLALAAAVAEFALSILALGWFDATAGGMQFVERHRWIDTLNAQYLVGVDGLSLPFLPLTSLLTVAVILASWRGVHHLPRLYFALLLALQGITIGIYCALDLILFFLFWELTLPPLFFLISLWGIGPQRRHAATQYTLFMLAGGAALLFGFILLALNHARETGQSVPQGLSFDFPALLDTPVPPETQSAIFLLLFLGFAIKAPVFPFHVWLPTTAMQGPAAVGALLTGLKLGLFGIIRFAVPLAPQAANRHFGLIAVLGVTGAIYGALVALRQSNLRRLLAFSSISHVGMVLIGIAAFNIQGIQGAAFQTFNFGLVAGGLFLLAGFLQQRLGSTELTSLGGAARPMPLLASLFFILGLAGMGIPGTNGFAAEHLMLIGAFRSHTGMGVAALIGVVLGAAYFLAFFRQAFLGPVLRKPVASACDLLPRELCVVGGLAALALIFGLHPQPMLDLSRKPLQAWVSRLDAGPPTSLARHNPSASTELANATVP